MKIFLCLLLELLLATCSEGDTYLRHEGLPSIQEKDVNLLNSHVFKENVAGLDKRSDISKQSVISPNYIHEVIFAIKQKNMDELTRILHDVSNPSSPNYGHHLTKKEVSSVTSNPTSRDAVISYLQLSGAKVTAISLDSEYITASAPVSLWNELFHTEFFQYLQTELRSGKINKLIRAEKYWIPKTLESHVESVLNTIQMPMKVFGSPSISVSPIADESTSKSQIQVRVRVRMRVRVRVLLSVRIRVTASNCVRIRVRDIEYPNIGNKVLLSWS
jgi:subtilase family serine protease